MTTAEPTEQPRPARERILVLLANRENRDLLTRVLEREYDVVHAPPQAASEPQMGSLDLCVLDGPSLRRYAAEIRALRDAAQPALFPTLLLTERRDVGLATREVWRLVDDVLLRPVEKIELRARFESLLRARRLSLSLERISGLYEYERRVAERFQSAAMLRALPDVHGVRFSAYYAPGGRETQIGGDWYDAMRLADGRVVFSIGDVCGAGLAAAVAMANIRQVLRGVAQLHPDPAMMLEATDRALLADDPDRTATAFVGVYDSTTAILQYSCAGHPRPILRTPDGALATLGERNAGDVLLGLPGGPRRTSHTLDVQPGSLLVLYTDGLTEATRDIEAGERRLRGALARSSVLAAPALARAVFASVLIEPPHDDVAILTVKFAERDPADRTVRRWSFDVRDADAARTVRAELLADLDAHRLAAADRAAAELVFGELVGNTVRYAPGPVEVTLDWSGDAPVLHVLDSGPGFRHLPRLPRDILSEGGRGLYIISSTTREFNITERPRGGSHARAVLALSARPA